MKKIRLLLALFAASIGSLQSAWARTAPTLPETTTLESGKTYYLYNASSDRFLYQNDETPEIVQGRATSVTVTQMADKTFMLQFSNNNRYIWTAGGDLGTQTGIDQDVYFRIETAEGGYIIRRNRNYNDNQYVGYNGTTRANSNVANDGNILWQFISSELKDEVDMYTAKTHLNSALNIAEATNYEVSDYNDIYEEATQTASQIANAGDRLYESINVSGRMHMSWSDYPILFAFHNSGWRTYDNDFDSPQIKDGGRATITATVNVDEDATMVYDARNLWSKVYLDDELVAYNNNAQALYSDQNHYVEMGPGKHVIKWVFENDGSSNASGYLYNVGIERTPTITVSLLEPGSLGTEILKNTDHIQNVRKLVISGPMNDDDWKRILMMTSLFTLDLTDAEITEIPESPLSYYSHSSSLSFFHEVKLPQTIKVIGDYAFKGSNISATELPDGLTTIGNQAFSGTRIPQAIIPETVTSIGEYAFSDNHYLNHVSYPAAARIIPDNCFNDCQCLQPFEIPEGITSIGYRAFYQCFSYRTSIPASVTSIGSYAFNNCNLDNVVIRENVSVSNEAFEYSKLKTIEFPTSMYNAPSQVVKYCTSMTDIYLKSPTMVKPNSMLAGCKKNILTVHVPDYLVNTYKQNSYWYQYNIEGFSTEDIKDWYINQPLTLEADARIAGQPNIHMERSGSIKISGNAPMTIDELYTCKDWNVGEGWNTMILSTCDNVSINGRFTHRVYTPSKCWVFICLPFDTKVGDITCESSFAIRYYDGANRAENGSGGNWKNYSKDDVIPAGTGFILQTSTECSTWFTAQENDSKQYVFQNREFIKALDANASENNANKGWNLVGNPWFSYYNIHKLNFTAPITCWNVNNRNYRAYSIIDDDYAIKPGEAFFVQCPDEVNSISFPIDGRQLTSKIESQNAVKPYAPMVVERKLIDVELSDGELTDKTRFVVNPDAEMSYELNRDASKFFSMDATVPQIYTIENGELLAINERPIGNGIVEVGFHVAVDGEYTIMAPRNGFKNIMLIDNETGIETDLSVEECYTFTANAGTNDSRFVLRVGGNVVTEIADVKQKDVKTNCYFNLNGQNVTTPTKGVYVANGKKVVIK